MDTSYNTTILTMGGSRDHLYRNTPPSAWEDFEDAKKRAPEGEIIGDKLTSLNARLGVVLSGSEEVQSVKTRRLIETIRIRIKNFSGDTRLKKKFEESLSNMESHFRTSGHLR